MNIILHFESSIMDTCPSSPIFGSPKAKSFDFENKDQPLYFERILQLEDIVRNQRQVVFQQYHQLQLQGQQLLFYSQQVNALQKQLSQSQGKSNNYGNYSIKDLVTEFIQSFQGKETRRTYQEGFSQLFQQEFLYPDMKLSDFKQQNVEHLLDQIRQNYKIKKGRSQKWSEASENTKQLRAAMFVSFSAFIQRRTEGYIAKVIPNRFGGNKTFRYRRERTIATRLTDEQISSFLNCLKSFSKKAFLFASLQIIGARRVSEVIHLRIEDLDLSNNRVFFRILKTKGLEREPIAIYLPSQLRCELEEYVKERSVGWVFLKGLSARNVEEIAITKAQVVKLYHRGWNLVQNGMNKENEIDNSTSKIPFKPRMITHSLRACGITYLFERSVDSQLIKEITGHNSGDMVHYYKNSGIENISKKIHILNLP